MRLSDVDVPRFRAYRRAYQDKQATQGQEWDLGVLVRHETLFAYVVTGLIAHPSLLTILTATFIPHLELSKDFMVGLVAILGTTISPYLFFWQASAEIDEMRAAGQMTEAERQGVKLSELKAARVDIVIGMAFSQIVILIVLLGSDRKVMKDKVSGALSKSLTWIGTASMAAAALALVLFTFVLKISAQARHRLLHAHGLVHHGCWMSRDRRRTPFSR